MVNIRLSVKNLLGKEPDNLTQLTPAQIYNLAKGNWSVDGNKIKSIDRVLAVYKGRVVADYEVKSWKRVRVKTGNKVRIRYAFGGVAVNNSPYIGKYVPVSYGQAIRYFDGTEFTDDKQSRD